MNPALTSGQLGRIKPGDTLTVKKRTNGYMAFGTKEVVKEMVAVVDEVTMGYSSDYAAYPDKLEGFWVTEPVDEDLAMYGTSYRFFVSIDDVLKHHIDNSKLSVKEHCQCDIKDLFNRGCGCGHIAYVRSVKWYHDKKNDLKYLSQISKESWKELYPKEWEKYKELENELDKK